MPEKVVRFVVHFKCELCGKSHETESAANLCEYSHIKLFQNDRVEVTVNGRTSVYKLVVPSPDRPRTAKEEQDWHDLMIIGSRCG